MTTSKVQDFYPLSPMQQGMLFHTLYAPAAGVLVEQVACVLRGPLDRPAFARAWGRVIERHPILRTGFVTANVKEPVQVVHRSVALPLAEHDWRDLAPDEQERRLAAFMAAEQRAGFTLTEPPLLRLAVIRLSDDAHRFVWTYHHILLDGWSLPLLLQEVLAHYAAFARGGELQLPPPRPFRAYIAWLRQQDAGAAERFWRATLAGFAAPTPLAVERGAGAAPARTEQGTQFDEAHATLDPAATSRLQAVARRLGITLNTAVQGAWALLLGRYAGEADVVFGATVSGRPPAIPGAEQMIGLFINTLPVRVRIDEAQPVGAWLQALQARQAELRQFEHSPLMQVQGWSELPRGTPLFESLLVFENFPVGSVASGDGPLRVEDVRSAEIANSTYPLTLVAEPGEGLRLRLVHDLERIDPAAAARMVGHLATLLDAMAADPARPLGALELLSERERAQLAAWNNTARPFPAGCVHEQVDAVAARTPDVTAVVYAGGGSLSYAELNARANQLAHYLRRRGVGRDTLVAVQLRPGLELPVAVLGVMKAGGAYLPLDPSYPAERLRFMREDARPALLLTRAGDGAHEPGASVIDLVADWPQIAREPTTTPAHDAAPDSLAYCIYTSGSTGTPKGALLEHRGLSNLGQVLLERFAITRASRVLQFAAFGFDASVTEIFMALLGGATLVLADRETLSDPQALLALLREQRITTVTLPPSLLAVLPDAALPDLATLASAGEACPWEVAERWAAGRRFLNGYGPTEATVAAAYHEVGARLPDSATVPIGGPIANAQLHVLDAQMRPQPVGVPGELYIAGAGLARGYLNRPELTAERFIVSGTAFGAASGRDAPAGRLYDGTATIPGVGVPGTATIPGVGVAIVPGAGAGTAFGAASGRDAPAGRLYAGNLNRLYKTGDRARWLPDGTVEFLGRVDQQVKLRGFRIELGEIEAALHRQPAVQDAAVILREDQPGNPRIVAYVVPAAGHAGAGAAQLREALSAQLPGYMLPAAIVSMEAFPLTPAGKVDRRALPAPDGAGAAAAYVAPHTPEEELLALAFAQLLGVQRVGAHDNFFELGGHSLLATQLVSRLRDTLGVELPLRALFEAPTLAELAQQLRAARLAAEGLALTPIVPMERGGELPLSYAQQRLWFLDQLEPDSPLYNVPAAVRLVGPLDAAALERALDGVVQRHEILRGAIVTAGGRPQLRIAPELRMALPLIDLGELPAEAREAELRRLAAEDAQRPFDLAAPPLMRVQLLRLAPDEHVAIFTLHHVVTDGWSLGVFVRDLAALYAAAREGAPDPLPPLPVQYADYAAWQRGWLQGETLEQQLAYWRRQLRGAPPLLELPTDRPRPPVRSSRGGTAPIALPAALAEGLRALSRREGATMFMTLLAAFKLLLMRYSRQDDVSVGTTIANRTRGELEPLIGFFVNTLVLRTDLSGEPSFRELLGRVRETALGAYAHQDLPFEMLVDALQPERSMSYSPLFQVLFSLQNAPLEAAGMGELQVSTLEAESGTAKFDLTLELQEGPDGLNGALEYNADLFDADTIGRMLAQFATLLAAIVAEPDAPITRLPLLDAVERRRLTAGRSQPRAFPAERTLHGGFAAQAARTPDAIAVSLGGDEGDGRATRLSYRELDERANRLAHQLRGLGVGPERLVALYLDRSVEMVVAILAVLKAGGAYLPIDLAYPAERIAFMLDDARPAALITEQAQLAALADAAQLPTVLLDRDWPQVAQQPATEPASDATPESLAYVIYTSGSTGKPKGCLLSHANVVRLFTATEPWYDFGPRDVWTLFHSYAFDFSVWEIWGALLYGGRLVVVPFWLSRSPEQFLALLRDEGVTVLNQTPSAFRQLIRAEGALPAPAPLALRYVIFGGEALEFASLRPWFERHGDAQPRLVNMYGITETTVHVTYRPVRLADLDGAAASAIGVPIPDLTLLVLDQQLEPVPLGVPGELYVGGAGVARGYLNRPELTAERFIDDPFGPPGGRLYKTGDLARLLPDGDVEYLGRIDEQVKIRGFRIELDEIGTVLAQHPLVAEGAVVVREDQPGQPRLVAYLVPRPAAGPDLAAALRAHLGQFLPDYMLPGAFVALERLPLTTNGKLDRRALPVPEVARRDLTAAYVAPRTPQEETLAAIWARLLGLERVGVEDNFFAIGGDSLLSIQVIAQAVEAGLHLAPRQFFQQPTIAALAALAGDAPLAAAEGDAPRGPLPLTPIQRWFFAHHPERPDHWNVSILLEVPAEVRPELLRAATRALLAHHDALRLRFTNSAQGWEQRVAPCDDAESERAFSTIDLAHVPGRKQREAIEQAAAALQTSLDLADGPLFRVAYMDLGQGRKRTARVLVLFHHLVADGVSLRIVLGDLLSLYARLERGEPAALPPVGSSFARWARELSTLAATDTLHADLAYWRGVAERPVRAVPVDTEGGTNTYGGAERLVEGLSPDETRALLQLAPRQLDATIDELLLTALALAYRRWSGAGRLLVERDIHGREDLFDDVDLSRTVGWFTSVYPLLLDVGLLDGRDALRAVRTQLRAVPRRGVSYGILRELSPDAAVRAELERVPQPQISFNYLGQFDQPLGPAGDAEAGATVPFRVAAESPGPEQYAAGARPAALYIVGIVAGGALDLQWSYSPGLHRRATIERLAKGYLRELRKLIALADPS